MSQEQFQTYFQTESKFEIVADLMSSKYKFNFFYPDCLNVVLSLFEYLVLRQIYFKYDELHYVLTL